MFIKHMSIVLYLQRPDKIVQYLKQVFIDLNFYRSKN